MQTGSLNSSPYIIKSDNTSSVIKAAKEEILKQKSLIEAHQRGLSLEYIFLLIYCFLVNEVNKNDTDIDILPSDENIPLHFDLEQIAEESSNEDEDCDDESDEDIENTNKGLYYNCYFYFIFFNFYFLERDRICNDLAELQEDISIKEKLVAELEQKEKRLAQLRRDYERKLGELSGRITQMETERDRILAEMTSKSNGKHSEEKIKQVKEDYEKRLGSLRCEFKKYQSIEKEHKRMQIQQQKQLDDMRRIQNDILEMKRNKVYLLVYLRFIIF